MAEIAFRAHHQALRRRLRGRQGHEPGRRRRRVHDSRRTVGLREVDRAADGRRTRGHHRRRAEDRRPGRQRQGAEGPRHRDGVPELRAVSAHDRAREHGLRAEAGEDAGGRDRPQGQRGGEDPRPRAAPRSQAGQPVGRPAPARRDGPRDRPQPERVPDGRAAVEPRRQAARADADRDLADPAAARARPRSTSPTIRPRR